MTRALAKTTVPPSRGPQDAGSRARSPGKRARRLATPKEAVTGGPQFSGALYIPRVQCPSLATPLTRETQERGHVEDLVGRSLGRTLPPHVCPGPWWDGHGVRSRAHRACTAALRSRSSSPSPIVPTSSAASSARRKRSPEPGAPAHPAGVRHGRRRRPAVPGHVPGARRHAQEPVADHESGAVVVATGAATRAADLSVLYVAHQQGVIHRASSPTTSSCPVTARFWRTSASPSCCRATRA